MLEYSRSGGITVWSKRTIIELFAFIGIILFAIIMYFKEIINISSLGLIFDIIGVVLLFFNGPPISPLFINGEELITTNPDPEKAKKAKRNYQISSIALGLIIIGFILQLLGNFVIYSENYIMNG